MITVAKNIVELNELNRRILNCIVSRYMCK